MSLDPIELVIEDIRQGRMVVVMDDENRENEGDLVMAAEKVTPADINFMARYGRGLICLTLTPDRCDRLNLPLMVDHNQDSNGTNFTVSIEAAEGVTTGISAADRATTVQAAVAADAKPEDLVMPGHIFPLRAQPGGVLVRAGHTEAGCDMARLAGLDPSAVIVEILNEDGSMARYPQLIEFARTHGLRMTTVADLIRYRSSRERLVERVSETELNTPRGPVRLLGYQEMEQGPVHLAFVKGEINPAESVLVRVQVGGMANDLRLLAGQSETGWTVDRVVQRLSEEPAAVLVLIDRVESGAELLRQLQEHRLRDLGVERPGSDPEDALRRYGIGACILADLGVGKMRLLGRSRKIHGLAGFGLELEGFVAS
ncbi:MAG: 3,4-dihydroxy-2-butanone-4-phosphate synthase [Gammaproteobacteria bacterium]|nr:3,4-dihydroxy-2-butanone-4-phosphate synthase [Gammaproteobacteria bacterium]